MIEPRYVMLETNWVRKDSYLLKFPNYGFGRIGIVGFNQSGEQAFVATVNLPDEPIPDGCVFIKDYSENEGMLEALTEAGIVEPTGQCVQSGFVQIPIARLLVS